MTWNIATLIVLGAAVAGGFAWYERSRPGARVLALVAAMAALAVVGRLAFAAFPNVKPTTDIVFFAGYALGGAPGFAVGAITAVASNVFLGQGPWTPWQMIGWGGVGVFGAVIAKVANGRELSRWWLATACGVAGLGYGAFLDVYQTSYTAQPGIDGYWVVAGTSLPYNLAHAAGNVVFCLVIGPAMVRALTRYKRRFEVRWTPPRPAVAAALIGALLVGGLSGGAGEADAAQVSASKAGDRALAYLRGAQNSDGGFGGAEGQSSSQLYSAWAGLGIASAGVNPADVKKGGKSVLSYTRAGARGFTDPGELERTILLAVASGANPRSFGGRDLVKGVISERRSNGSIGGVPALTAFGILALRAAGEDASSSRVRSAASWLARQQNTDGGWGLGPRGGASDVDNTSAVIQAFAAAGRRGSVDVRRAVAFLRKEQNPDGGFGATGGSPSNAQSTAWAVQGALASGMGADSLSKGSRSPTEYIASLQNSDGSIRYSRTSTQTPVWVTGQTLTALERRPFPIARVARRAVAVSAAPAAPASEGRPRERRRREKRATREAVSVESARGPASAPDRA
ncbi:MAG: hypothetical protein H0V29_07035, partial [Thermoleophilaceae bacterium]|nr:hypothetical protein [Thermoleophilaceae bacterium]